MNLFNDSKAQQRLDIVEKRMHAMEKSLSFWTKNACDLAEQMEMIKAGQTVTVSDCKLETRLREIYDFLGVRREQQVNKLVKALKKITICRQR